MRILITGAAGFIGSSLVDYLIEKNLPDLPDLPDLPNLSVVGLDNFDDAYDPKIKHANLAGALRNRQFQLIEGDFRDSATIEKVFSECQIDTVVHLGARAGVRPSIEQAPLYVDNNLLGTTRILEACRQSEAKKVIFASSSSVYGARAAEPFSENDKTESPISPYAATKKAGELLCYTYSRLGLDITALRFFTVYGPRQRPEMAIHKFTRAIDQGETITIYGDGNARRDFTYISDIVNGIYNALNRRQSKGKGFNVYNLGGGNMIGINNTVRLIEKELGKGANIRYTQAQPGDVPNTLADITLASKELDYQPKVSVNDGIRKFVQWYKDKYKI